MQGDRLRTADRVDAAGIQDAIEQIAQHIGVVAQAADQGVRAQPARQDIVAAVAGDQVWQGIAARVEVAVVEQGQVLDIGRQGIGRCSKDCIIAVAGIFKNQVRARIDIVNIVAGTTAHLVDAQAAVQRVVASETKQGVGTCATKQ